MSTSSVMMLVLALVVVAVRAEDYCSISPRHTACPANNPKVATR